MTFELFLLLLLNTFLIDGYSDPECVALALAWSRVIGGPRFTGNAIDIYNQAGDFYDQIPNSPTNVPSKGDIVVLKEPYGKVVNPDGSISYVGHVVVASGKGDTNSFEAVEQNDPEKTNIQLKTYDYSAVVGWLHPKQLPQDLSAALVACQTEQNINWDIVNAIAEALSLVIDASNKEQTKSNLLAKVTELVNGNASKQSTLDSLNQTITDKNSQISTMQTSISELNKQLESKDMTIQTLQEQAAKVPDLSTKLAQAENDRTICLTAQTSQNTIIANLRATIANGKPKTLLGKLVYLFSK